MWNLKRRRVRPTAFLTFQRDGNGAVPESDRRQKPAARLSAFQPALEAVRDVAGGFVLSVGLLLDLCYSRLTKKDRPWGSGLG
jgi:hypothetical protein